MNTELPFLHMTNVFTPMYVYGHDRVSFILKKKGIQLVILHNALECHRYHSRPFHTYSTYVIMSLHFN